MQLPQIKPFWTLLMSVNLALATLSAAEILPPERGDWSPPREIIGLRLGAEGSWDDHPPGAITPCTMIKLGGTYYLYYIGSDGKRDHDLGPAHRKLGLATSSNGLDFSKYHGNPILSWSPAGNDEEGLFGAKGTVINGTLYLYLNTLSAKNATTDQVWGDVHLVTSRDGIHFSEPILVLDHSDPDIVGYGDELGPTGIIAHHGRWSLYYFAKGVQVTDWRLCLATGDSPTSLSTTRQVIDESGFFGTGGDIHWLSADKFMMFFQKRNNWERIELYAASAKHPEALTKTGSWDNFVAQGGITIFLDKEAGKWFMYNRAAGKTYVRTAPARHAKEAAPGVETHPD